VYEAMPFRARSPRTIEASLSGCSPPSPRSARAPICVSGSHNRSATGRTSAPPADTVGGGGLLCSPAARAVAPVAGRRACPRARHPTLHDRVVALVVSVLYRGAAISVAWHMLPADEKEAWLPHFQHPLALLVSAIPARMRGVALTDCGLGSPALWSTICGYHWHPVMRVANDIVFQPTGHVAVPPGRWLPDRGTPGWAAASPSANAAVPRR